MKATAKEAVFKPVTIEITLESKEEIAQLYALFNHSKTLKAIGHENDGYGKTIRTAICQSLGITSDDGPCGWIGYHDRLNRQ